MTPASSKQGGAWEVSRTIKLYMLPPDIDRVAVEGAVSALPAVHEVVLDVANKQIHVGYDASQTDYQSILDALKDMGISQEKSAWNRLKAGWFQYLDTNARENARAAPPACCNKPPKPRG